MPVPEPYTDVTGLAAHLRGPFLEAAAFMADSDLAERTRSDYTRRWEWFESYCADRGLEALGATPETVSGALVACVRPVIADDRIVGTEVGASNATQLSAAISWAHRRAGLDDPTRCGQVAEVRAGIERVAVSAPTRRALPLRPDDIRNALRCAPVNDTTGRHRLAWAAWRADAPLEWLMEVPRSGVSVDNGVVVIEHGHDRVLLEGTDDPLSDPVRIAEAWLALPAHSRHAFRRGDAGDEIARTKTSWRRAANRVRTVNLGRRDLRTLPAGEARLVAGAIGDRSVAWVRDRAEITTGWRGGLRPSELSNSNYEHYSEYPGRGIVLGLPKSKTDQYGRGQYVALPEVDDVALSAPAAIADWLAYRGRDHGPMFCKENGDRIKTDAIRKTIKRCAGVSFTGYSMRRGHATSAAEAGATLLQTAVSLRHSTPVSTPTYIDSADGLQTVANVLASIGGGSDGR